MNKSHTDIKLLQNLQKYQKDLQGVFTIVDLYNLIGFHHSPSAQKVINRLIENKALTRVKRGLYVTPDFDLWKLASHIQKNSYISMHSVLAKEGLTGTLNHNRVDVVTIGLGKTLAFQNYRLRLVSISEDLFFGFQKKQNGIYVADVEKAFLDILYYHLHGHKFAIDPLQEIDVEKLNQAKLLKYMKRYKNPKFVQFVKGVLNGQSISNACRNCHHSG